MEVSAQTSTLLLPRGDDPRSRGAQGAVVPIGITSKVPGTESIAILVAKNPNMLAALFELPPGTEPSITTRVKMRETSDVYALVKAVSLDDAAIGRQ